MKKSIFILVAFIIVHFTFILEDCTCQWEPDVRLTNDPNDSETEGIRNVAVNGDFVHAVWNDNRDGNREIYYKRSTNGGTNWEADVRLTNSPGISDRTCVTVYGLNIHVVWRDTRDGNGEIYYKRSTNGGVNWGTDMRLTNNPSSQQEHSAMASDSVVHIVWEDWRHGFPEIYYKRSTNGGVNWDADMRLTNDPAYSWGPDVTLSDSTVHVVWTDERDGNWEIYYKRSTDVGVNWEADTQLTNNNSDKGISCISIFGTVVHVVWYDNRDGNYEIYYKRSTDGGINWGADTRLTNATGNSWCPTVSVLGTYVHIVWQDQRDGNWEIYYKRSTDGGTNWEEDVRLTNNPAISDWATVAISGPVVHVLWKDKRDGNWEIYYKRNLNGNPTKIVNINSEIPEKFVLEQNYPNPFNSVTSIKFQVTMGSRLRGNDNVVLKVFDMLGREVATLVNEKLQAGFYQVTFDAGDLPSGIYFYRLKTDDFSETKKLTLFK